MALAPGVLDREDLGTHPVQGCGRSGANGPAGGDDGLGLGVRRPAGTRRAHLTLLSVRETRTRPA